MFVFFTYLDEWGALPRGGAFAHVTLRRTLFIPQCPKYFNFNFIQRAFVLEDYAPALGVAGFVSRKKGARSKGKEEKEGKKNNIR